MTDSRAPHPPDPVRFCVLTTVAILALLLTPAVMIATMAGLGLWAYWRAWRQGLTESRCLLRDTRLVMTYLGAAFVLGVALALRALLGVATRR